MTQRLTSAELTCIVGVFIWTIGELHTHVETQSIRMIPDNQGLAPTITLSLAIERREARLLREMLRQSTVTSTDEFSSRTLLEALITQSGATPLEFPELPKLLNPSSALPLQLIVAERQAMLSAIPTISPAEGWLASPFGDRMDPITKRKSEHRGLDISNNEGTYIRAPSNGIVRYAARYGGFGNYVSLVHGHGIVTKYAHLKEVRVKAGQNVKRGDIIAVMGSSGKSTGSHVHYEVWINDKPFNPYAFMPKVMKPGSAKHLVSVPDNLPSRQQIELATSH